MHSRTLLVVAALAVVLAGCAGGGAGGTSGPTDAASFAGGAGGQAAPETGSGASGGAAMETATAAGDGGGSSGGDVSTPAAADRAIVRTGRMRVRVDDFAASRQRVSTRARELGGFVGAANQTRHRTDNRTWTTGYVVVRVPTDQYDAMRETASRQGTVLEARTQTEDVSDQLVDLQARLENLRARRDRLRSFYDQADSTDELLQIEDELSSVQGRIERVRAQQRALQRRVAYSTLRVELREPEPPADEPTPTPAYHERSLSGTFLSSVADIATYGRALLVTAAGMLPWLLLSVAGLGVVWGAVRGLRASDGAGAKTGAVERSNDASATERRANAGGETQRERAPRDQEPPGTTENDDRDDESESVDRTGHDGVP
ncbi:MAG: DUF4349 domain-containing protein [Haloarculaceae archaeon]